MLSDFLLFLSKIPLKNYDPWTPKDSFLTLVTKTLKSEIIFLFNLVQGKVMEISPYCSTVARDYSITRKMFNCGGLWRIGSWQPAIKSFRCGSQVSRLINYCSDRQITWNNFVIYRWLSQSNTDAQSFIRPDILAKIQFLKFLIICSFCWFEETYFDRSDENICTMGI